MGYLLPIRPLQSQQYANRMNIESYDFVTVRRLQAVELKSDFLEEFEETLHSQNEDSKRRARKQSNADRPPRLFKGYAQPNPTNLSPIISRIVGKGMSVNTYI